MKKNLFYLFALICSMSLFTACSDDDDENWKKVPSQIITAENLELETNIPTSSDASVKLAMTDAQNGILTLNKVVRGADEIEINVTVVEQTDGTFKFQGEKSVTPATKAAWVLLSSTNVKVSGTITLEGKATVTVSTEYGYTLMAWEPHRNDWYSAEIQKTPEDLRNALLDTYANFLEDKITGNDRDLTVTETGEIQQRCRELFEKCREN